jgi:hypothetical protein
LLSCCSKARCRSSTFTKLQSVNKGCLTLRRVDKSIVESRTKKQKDNGGPQEALQYQGAPYVHVVTIPVSLKKILSSCKMLTSSYVPPLLALSCTHSHGPRYCSTDLVCISECD